MSRNKQLLRVAVGGALGGALLGLPNLLIGLFAPIRYRFRLTLGVDVVLLALLAVAVVWVLHQRRRAS